MLSSPAPSLRDGLVTALTPEPVVARAAVDVATARATEEYVVATLTVDAADARYTEQGVVVGISVWAADRGPASESVAPRGKRRIRQSDVRIKSERQGP